MFTLLHALASITCPQPGGLQGVLLVDPLDLTAPPTWGVSPVVSALNFKPGRGAYALSLAPRSGAITDKTNTSPQGDTVEVTVTGSWRGTSIEQDWLRQKLRNRRVHLIAVYIDGRQRFVPLCRVEGSHQSGARTTPVQSAFQARTLMTGVPPWLTTTPPVLVPTPIPPEVPPTIGTTDPVIITTASASYTYTVPSGRWLVGVEVLSNTTQTPRVGLTSGGDELGSGYVPANNAFVIEVNSQPTTTAYQVHISALAGNNTIKFWIL